MGIRVFIKVLVVLALSVVIAVWGLRWLTGRYPTPVVGAGVTAAVFAAFVALDAWIGW